MVMYGRPCTVIYGHVWSEMVMYREFRENRETGKPGKIGEIGKIGNKGGIGEILNVRKFFNEE